MQTETLTLNGWTVRFRAPISPGPHPVMLLLHGWTGDETVMWVFAAHLSPRYLLVAPRAPYETPRGGYGWQPSLETSWPSLEALRPAADGLLALLDTLAAHPRTAAGRYGLFDVMGFSQGAAVAATLALLYPQRVRALALLAGFLPDGAGALTASRPLAGKFVFAAHGAQDALVPVGRARQGVSLLQQAGAQVTYCEDAGGHKLGASCARALRAFWASLPPEPLL